MPTDEVEFHAVCEPRCVSWLDHKWKQDKGRLARLRATPPFQREVRGSYAMVSTYCTAKNELQLKQGYLEFLFSPDVVGAPKPVYDDAGVMEQ